MTRLIPLLAGAVLMWCVLGWRLANVNLDVLRNGHPSEDTVALSKKVFMVLWPNRVGWLPKDRKHVHPGDA